MKNDNIWNRDEIASPCIRVCMIHPEARICTGCLRTIDEIAQWARMTPDQRTAIMEALPDRRPRLAQRRGGSSGRRPRPLKGDR